MENLKTCTICKISKNVEEYYLNKKTNKYENPCKNCRRIRKKEQRYANLEYHQEYQKKYKNENREKYNEWMRHYKKNNQDKFKEIYRNYYYQNGGKEKKKEKDIQNRDKIREYDRNRYQNDIQHKLRKILRTRINKFIKGKKSSSKELLDCDIQFYKQYIEFQFTDEMNWENYGTYWNIDHVKPCSSFNLEDKKEQKECFKWSNTRPMIRKNNESKNNKINIDEIENQKKIVNEFLSKVPNHN